MQLYFNNLNEQIKLKFREWKKKSFTQIERPNLKEVNLNQLEKIIIHK